MFSPAQLVSSFFIGTFSGLLAALCGVGGGILLVPAFTKLMGMDHKQAVATSLAIIVPTAIAATISNARSGLVAWPIVGATAVGAVIAAVFGTALMKNLSNPFLTRLFAVLLICVGVQMLFAKPKAAAAPAGDNAPQPEEAAGGE